MQEFLGNTTYYCRTRKGRDVYVRLTHFPACLLHEGELWKLRNDVSVYDGCHVPLHDYQWYQLDKITGKKLKTIAVEEL